MPSRRIGELQYVDEFITKVEELKDGFVERTMVKIVEMEKSVYERNQEKKEREAKEKAAKEALANGENN